MKKLLILLLLSTSFSTFANSHLDFYLSDFCYLQPGVQDRFEDGDYKMPWSDDGTHFYESLTYYFPNKEVGITATSICVYKNAHGQYESKGNLKNGKKDGKWTTWWKDGEKQHEVNYKDGKKHGKEYLWGIYFKNDDWNVRVSFLQSESNYKDGLRDGKETMWYSNETGQKWYEENYKDGKYDGKVIYWYKNGQKKVEGNFKDGMWDGKRTSWYENGQIALEENYKDGMWDGKRTLWYENGAKKGEGEFKLGTGKYTSWIKSGKKKSEAIYKDGECISGDCPK